MCLMSGHVLVWWPVIVRQWRSSKLVTESLTFGVEGIVGLVAGHDFSGDKLIWWPNVRCLVFGYLFLVFFGLLMSAKCVED